MSPAPLPPPPPPPMPNFDLRVQPGQLKTQHVLLSNLESEPEIDLVSPSGYVKPHLKMRTLNWRRIPKRRVLSNHLLISQIQPMAQDPTTSDPQNKMFHDMNIESPNDEDKENNENLSSQDFSDDEATNIWFKIAKSNSTSKHAEQPMSPPGKLNTTQGQSDISQDTITNSGGSQPVSNAGGKSSSRIREMLEAVRRRMATVAAASSPASLESDITRTPTNGGGGGSHNNSSYLFQAYDLESKRPLTSIQSPKPASVLEAMDFHSLESLFCLNTQPAHNHLDDDSNSSGSGPGQFGDSIDFSSKNILDSKKSLNVNIFLKQLKNQTKLIEQINDGNNKLIGEERLQSILKLLPDDNERVQLMKFHTRDKQHRLPVAEKFLLELLVRVPNLKLKIKFMLMKEKYCNDIDEHIPSKLDEIDAAICELRQSRKFRDLLNLVLVTGNFLNSGSYAADAFGFSLDCLNHLHEVHSNRQGIYLIHYIAEIAAKMHLVEFQSDELTHIESASRVCLESIKLDLVQMSEHLHDLKCDIDNLEDNNSESVSDNGENDSIASLRRTMVDIKCNVDFLKKRVFQDLETRRKKLAVYLCEDPVTFNLHECFSCIQSFSRRLKTATEENERRLRVAKKKSSLKRSSTIHSRLPKQSNITSLSNRRQIASGRMSLGGESIKQPDFTLEPAYFDKKRASFGAHTSNESRRPFGLPGDIVRTSSTCSSMVKSSRSSLSSHNTSSSGNNSDCDDLHDCLMRILNDSTSRRTSGPLRCVSGRFNAQ